MPKIKDNPDYTVPEPSAINGVRPYSGDDPEYRATVVIHHATKPTREHLEALAAAALDELVDATEWHATLNTLGVAALSLLLCSEPPTAEQPETVSVRYSTRRRRSTVRCRSTTAAGSPSSCGTTGHRLGECARLLRLIVQASRPCFHGR